MSYADDNPGYVIDSADQALKYLEGEIQKVIACRVEAEIIIPSQDAMQQARTQKKAHRNLLIRYGAAIGALTVLHRTRKISDTAYNELNRQISKTLMPTTVGSMTS